MESPHTKDETTGYYQNSLTPDIENTTQSHYQKLKVEVISVGDNQYDQLSPGTLEDTKPYDGYLQLPEFNKKNIESNYDYLKLYGSVKTKQCPDIGSIELSDFSSGHNVDTENRPSDKSKQDIVALDSIHLNEDIYHEIIDTARPNLNQARQGSKKHVDDSQTLHTNTDATSTERPKTSVSKRTYLTWRQKYMFSVIGVGITIIIAVGTVIYFVVNKESEKEAQNYVSCTDVLDARLYFGPKEMVCIIPKSEQFDYLGFYHGNGLNNSLYGIVLNKNGTVFQLHKPNTDIYVRLIKVTSQYMLIITFSNVSCAMDGSYRLALMRQVAGGPEEYKSTRGYLQVTSLSGNPTISLNADQVKDLGFPDGSYFRSAGTHICEGRIGQYHSNLEIDITYDNGKSFQHIPKESIDLSRQNTSDGCSTNQTVIFGLRFSSDMDGARLRCRVSDRIDDFTLSEEFSLIPRNICNCGVSGSYRGHPNNCKVQVYCIADDGMMYPTGITCPPSQCRNSLTGVCSSDCTDTVCNEAVPPDFCTTPATPTTSESPPPYAPVVTISSSSYSINLNNPVTLGCTVTANPAETTVYWQKIKNGVSTTINFNTNTNRYGGSSVQNPSLQIFSVVEDDEATYVCFAVNSVGTGQSSHTNLTVIGDFPGKPVLKLSVDQVIDLGFYRDSSVHSCAGVIGNPMRELILEILYVNTNEYKVIPGSILKDLRRNKSTTERQNYEKIQFALLFSSEMKDSKIRCRPSGNVNNETIAEESFALIPRDICSCGDSGDNRGHPGRCDSYVLCLAANNIMYPYGRACPDGQCRNSLTGICSTDCSDAVCNEGVPADFCTTTTIPATTPVLPKPSVEVSCNGSSIAINTGPVNVVCYFNEPLYEYINITFRMQNETIPRPVANVQASGNVVMIDQTSNLVIEIDVNVIKIKIMTAYCNSGGTYRVTVNTGGTPGFNEAILEILTKPNKPSIDQQLHTIEGKTVKYTCTGNVGNPPGSIEFLVRKNGEQNFTVSSFPTTSSELTPNDNCNNEQSFYHEHTITSNWNRTTIKCRAVNQRTITQYDNMNSYTSNDEEIILIAADYCLSSTTDYKAHPRGCEYYVRCVHSTPFGIPCAINTCFSNVDEAVPCVFCSNASPPCDSPTS